MGMRPYGLTVAQGPLEQARLPVHPWGEEAHEVATDRIPEQLARLVVAIDDVLRRQRMRVDERVDVGDHAASMPVFSCSCE